MHCLCRAWYSKAIKDQSFVALRNALKFAQRALHIAPQEKASTIKPVQPADERSRERERNERALSSSDSSKPSITGQSSAGMTDEDPSHPQHAHSNGHGIGAGKERKREEVNGDEAERLKSTDMGLPMLSPLKPLSPFGLH